MPARRRTCRPDPLDDQLWGLRSVRADLSHTVQPGDPRTLVGIIDTGVDGLHPGIRPNVNNELSRNFAPDIRTEHDAAREPGPRR